MFRMDFKNPRDVQPPSPELAPVFNDLQQSFSQAALNELGPLLTGIRSVQQSGTRITMQRDGAAQLPLNGELLNNNIKVTSLQFGDSVGFNYNRAAKEASSIDGVSLNVTIFNSPYSMKVMGARMGLDEAGNKVLHTQLENPLPEAAQRIIGMPNVINVKVPMHSEGMSSIKLSQAFSDIAASTGPSIAGLLASDALKEASKVALFAESNPRWVAHVVEPALHGIYKALEPTNPFSERSQGVAAVRAQINPPVVVSDQALAKPTPVPLAPIDVTKPGDYVFTSQIDGVERTYRAHVPPSYDGKKPMPLVLLLHGHAQSGEEIARLTGLDKVADQKGFIAVYPDATAWMGRRDWRAWDTDNGLVPPGSNADDVSFMRKIIESAEKNYAIDPNRIFVAGLSNGGMMSFRAAGELSDKVAAMAIVSGAMSGKEPPLKAPVSILNIHGTDDGIVPYEGLKNVPASLSAVGLPNFKPMSYVTDFWAEQNKIATPPIITQQGDVTQRRFVNPTNGVEVNEYTIHGGRHIPDDITGVVDTIWQFFEQHPKAPGTASGKPQPQLEEPFNITERLKAHINARGIQGLEIDAGQMLNEVTALGDGSFSPANTLQQFESKTGIKLADSVSDFLKITTDISKTQQRISFDLTVPQKFTVPNPAGGPVRLDSVNVDDPSFDLVQDNGRPRFRNVTGVSFTLQAFGRERTLNLQEIGQKLDGNGAPYYEMRTDNPLPAWSRTLMFAKSQIPIELQLNQSGHPSIMNERDIKDAALGVNPVSRGYIDIGTHAQDFYANPGMRTGLNLAKDVLIGGGTGYGAYKLASLKFARRGRIGIAAAAVGLAAPAIIHGIERL
jgi:polyhydroxybutyrate depolymerase